MTTTTTIMVRTTSEKHNSRTFQRQIKLFKALDLYNKLAFFEPLSNRTPSWLKHSMESFTIITSSAMVDHLSHYVVLLSVTTLLCKKTAVTGYDCRSMDR